MIYVIRHGETDLNKKKVLQGRSNQPLNEKGREQAQKARDFFISRNIRFDKVYSSPLDRAVETARILVGDDKIIIDERLIEMDYGPYEGMDLNSPAKEVMAFFSDFANTPAPEGMEQLSEVIERAGSFIEDLYPRIKEEENILISAHAISMKGILEYLTLASKGGYWSCYIGNCGIYAFAKTQTGYAVPEEYKAF